MRPFASREMRVWVRYRLCSSTKIWWIKNHSSGSVAPPYWLLVSLAQEQVQDTCHLCRFDHNPTVVAHAPYSIDVLEDDNLPRISERQHRD